MVGISRDSKLSNELSFHFSCTGDLAEDVDPELFYPGHDVEGHSDAIAEHGDIDDVMDHEVNQGHREDEHGPPAISDTNLDVLLDDTKHGRDRHNGEDEHHEGLDHHKNDINDFHSSHHDHNDDQDHDSFLHQEELTPHHVDGNEPHEPEHTGKVVIVNDDGDHIESHDTDNDLAELTASSSAHMPNDHNIEQQEMVNEGDDIASSNSHQPHHNDHTLDNALHDGQHHGSYHGALHNFDPDLYAKLGYWPYDHIDGDARQLYYAQWLKRHPIKHAERQDGQRLTGENIKTILAQKLHHFNKRSIEKPERHHYPTESELEKMKMYAEFLKRDEDQDHDEAGYYGGHNIDTHGRVYGKRLIETDHNTYDNPNKDNEPIKRKKTRHDGYTIGGKQSKDKSPHSINYVNPNHLLETRYPEELDDHQGNLNDEWSNEITNADPDYHRYAWKRLQHLDHEKQAKRNWQYHNWQGNEHVLG